MDRDKTEKKIFGVVLLIVVAGLLMATPIGALIAIGAGGWVVFLIYEYLSKKKYARSATIFVMFVGLPIIVATTLILGWIAGCILGTNGCRSPF